MINRLLGRVLEKVSERIDLLRFGLYIKEMNSKYVVVLPRSTKLKRLK